MIGAALNLAEPWRTYVLALCIGVYVGLAIRIAPSVVRGLRGARPRFYVQLPPVVEPTEESSRS